MSPKWHVYWECCQICGETGHYHRRDGVCGHCFSSRYLDYTDTPSPWGHKQRVIMMRHRIKKFRASYGSDCVGITAEELADLLYGRSICGKCGGILKFRHRCVSLVRPARDGGLLEKGNIVVVCKRCINVNVDPFKKELWV